MAVTIVGIGVAVLLGFGGAFLIIATTTESDPTVWWVCTWSAFAAAALMFIGLCVGLLMQKLRASKQQRFPPGQEPVMRTPPEHQKAQEARRVQQTQADVPRWRASSEVRSEREVVLTLRSMEDPPHLPAQGSCEVTDPEGRATGAPFSRAETAGATLTVRYPKHFEGATTPLLPGPYKASFGRHWSANDPDTTAYSTVYATTGFEIPVGVPGWDSKVIGVLGNNGELETIMLKLYPPDGRVAEGDVTLNVEYEDGTVHNPKLDTATFDDHHLEAGEQPHYQSFFPHGFRSGLTALPNGRYVVTWSQRRGATWRVLAEPHEFEIRNGSLVTGEGSQLRI